MPDRPAVPPARPAGVGRAAQVSPDRFWVGVLAVGLVTVIMAASYVFSFTAIAQAGAWTGVPGGVHWLAAVFIDGAILTYTVSLAVFQARGQDRRTLARTRLFLYTFTAASVALNFAHTGAYWRWDFTHMDAWFGALMAVSAPLAALAASEEVCRLAFTTGRDRAATGPETATPAAPTPAWEGPAEAQPVPGVPAPAAARPAQPATYTPPPDVPPWGGLPAAEPDPACRYAAETGDGVLADAFDLHRG